MPGFDFSNHNRNVALHAQGVPLPKATSTGTTIVGCLYDGGVVVSITSHLWPSACSHNTAALHDPLATLYVNYAFIWLLVLAKLTSFRSQQIPVQPLGQSWPTRTARSFITYHPRSGAPVQELPQTQNSQPPSYPAISSCTLSQRAGNHASSPA